MKTSDPSARNDIELPSAVHWPTVYAMAGVGGGLVAVLLAVVVIAAVQPATPQPAKAVADVRPAPPPRAADQMVKPAPQVEASSEPPIWKQLVPPPTPVVVKPIVQPVDVAAVLVSNTVSTNPPAASPLKTGRRTESELAAEVQALAKEASLDLTPRTLAEVLANSATRPDAGVKKDPSADHVESVVDLIPGRPDLAGLPVRGDSECRASDEAAKRLAEVSRQVRRAQSLADLSRRRDDADPAETAKARAQDLLDLLADHKDWQKDDHAPALAQMLCVEDRPVRLQLTRMLAATKGRKASIALARQAHFDLAPEVREAAIRALKDRPREEYRQTLVAGFRYPWPAVADRAAEALAALDDQAAIPALATMLEQPDPAAPVLNDKKQWVVAEIVKINHLRNCLLCHAPSTGADDPVRGFVPKPGEEIPVAYYNAPKGDFVRADVTYLRQDFSLLEKVTDPNKWPVTQRFDYTVRRRPLTEQEAKDLMDSGSPSSRSYPQREALLLTLQKLNRPAAAHTEGKVGLGP